MENNTVDLTKRTKGEWHTEISKYQRYTIVYAHPNKYICTVNGRNGNIKLKDDDIENEANAAFICKAVNNYDELLENLKRLVDRLEENDFGHMSAVKRAKEAIQKAEQ